MRTLLAAGADREALQFLDGMSVNALHFATWYGEESTMRVLLDNGADVNARTRGGRFGRETDDDELFLRKQIADGSYAFVSKMTVLQIAVQTGDAAKVRLLIDYGADQELEYLFDDEDHKSELESKLGSRDEVESLDQSQSGHVESDDEVSSYVEPYFDSNPLPVPTLEEMISKISKMTVIHVAAGTEAEDVLRVLLQHGDSRRSESTTPAEPTALHLAALLGSGEIAKMLLDQAVNVDPKDFDGTTPLHAAVQRGYGPVVNEYLEHGADVNTKDNYGKTPLHVAVSMGFCHRLVVLDLLDYGADLCAEDLFGYSPLLLAASYDYCDGIVDEFIHYGANLNAKNDRGRTVLHTAAAYGLLQAVTMLLSHDADHNARDGKEDTSLHLAARKGHDHVVKELLDFDADINAKNKQLKTPLHMAAHKGHNQVVKKLLDFDADVSARDRDEATPLHLAAKTGRGRVVRQILGHNVTSSSILVKTKAGFTALDLAMDWDNRNVISLLLEKLLEDLAGK